MKDRYQDIIDKETIELSKKLTQLDERNKRQLCIVFIVGAIVIVAAINFI
ncbi:hypothetical protein OIU80_19790 [Flavobacterium sp. LS1R47]|uniref:Uncharacterized protein n=1 Tax=Flavobacterium frigoritolerans TaxID=2987686 RepID=A0A9X3CAC1_9FLAO|nr:hypothetical protein [Flavobacterium frigoritolerans]MCV9934529.1 hypothetical protein [Flavobacterium frigoritolerans]